MFRSTEAATRGVLFKSVYKNFTNFPGKHVWWILTLNNVAIYFFTEYFGMTASGSKAIIMPKVKKEGDVKKGGDLEKNRPIS